MTIDYCLPAIKFVFEVMTAYQGSSEATRGWLARAFTLLVDVIYVGLAVLLGASALVLLINTGINFYQMLAGGTFLKNSVSLLDQMLLILLIVELLYTVQVSFREHALLPEPFLLVGLIAAVRRVLVLTAEFGQITTRTSESYTHIFIELTILTLLILTVTVSLVLVRRRGAGSEQQGK